MIFAPFFTLLDQARRSTGQALDAAGLGPIEAPSRTAAVLPGARLRAYLPPGALAEHHQADVAALVLLSGYFWTLRPDALLVMAGALPVLGDVLRYTVSPLLGWLQMPLLKWAMFSPARGPARFQAEYSPAMALRPSQIRATSVEGALLIPGAVTLRRDYKDLTLPVVIIAGDGDKVVFKRRSEQLRDSIPDSMLQTVKGAGHMVHHLAPRQVAEAVENVAQAASARPERVQPRIPGQLCATCRWRMRL